jgi:hypothetical protein
MGEWCGIQEDCSCRDSPLGEALTKAQKFSSGYEYKVYGFGRDSDGNGLKEIDCWDSVAIPLKELGYHAPARFGWPWRPASIFDHYFCPVSYEEAGPGDIIYFEFNQAYLDSLSPSERLSRKGKSHVGFIESKLPTDSGWTGEFFAAQSPSLGIKSMDWYSDQSFPPYPMHVAAIYRPMECEEWIVCEGAPGEIIYVAPATRRCDPLMLDLDGNGIRTLGFDADIHFDHDGDGFKELTGWVGLGDGMLMLDKNGNGRLDDATELFGDFMVLTDGMRTSNGFQALTFYDVNSDGKIDAHDPIWSQLKIWQHTEYITVAGEG